MGVGPGDEVITSPFTFIATGETICLAGATPVFADIDPHTFNLDPEAAQAKITDKTKVILPVHLFGQIADMTRLDQIARPRGIRLLGDAAQAIGATHQGKALGAWGEANTLSFYPTKNLGACGDGGMVLTDSEELADQIKLLRFHGSGGGYFHKAIGYCSRLDGMQAACCASRPAACKTGTRHAARTPPCMTRPCPAWKGSSSCPAPSGATTTSTTSTPCASPTAGGTPCKSIWRRTAFSPPSTTLCRFTSKKPMPSWATKRGTYPKLSLRRAKSSHCRCIPTFPLNKLSTRRSQCGRFLGRFPPRRH